MMFDELGPDEVWLRCVTIPISELSEEEYVAGRGTVFRKVRRSEIKPGDLFVDPAGKYRGLVGMWE